MANIQGNRIALEDTWDPRLPKHQSAQIQEPLGANRAPFYVRDVVAGTAWQQIEGDGYEVLFLAGDSVQQAGGLPAYVNFDNTQSEAGAIPVLAGTCIPVPQGFRRLWFRPSADTNWRLVVSRVPLVHIDYGPYAATQPGRRLLSSTRIEIPLTEPAAVTDGIAIPSRATLVAVRYYYDDAGTLSRCALTGPVQVFWWLRDTDISAGVPLWTHNAMADDMSGLALGDVSSTHDVERYECEGAKRIALYDDTGWTHVTSEKLIKADVLYYG